MRGGVKRARAVVGREEVRRGKVVWVRFNCGEFEFELCVCVG